MAEKRGASPWTWVFILVMLVIVTKFVPSSRLVNGGEIDDLKTQVEKLEKRLSELEKRVDGLEQRR